jgi:hypothetical protein
MCRLPRYIAAVAVTAHAHIDAEIILHHCFAVYSGFVTLLMCVLAAAAVCLQVLSSGTTQQTSRAHSLQAGSSQRSNETVSSQLRLCSLAAALGDQSEHAATYSGP